MTIRSVILGLLGALGVCSLTYFNDHVMRQTMLVGNNMPHSVYGGLILFLLVVNPLVLLAGKQRSPLGAGVVTGLLAGTAAALVGGLAAGAASGSTAKGLVAALLAGVLVGLATGLMAALGRAALVPRFCEGPLGALAALALGGLVAGLAGGLIAGVFTGLAAAIVAGLAAARRALSAREFAVVLCLTLAACAIPGSGLMRFMTNSLMRPHHMARTSPGWQAEEAIEMVPDRMLAGSSPLLRADDILDPSGLCLRMFRDGQGKDGASAAGARIWEFIHEADRDAISEAARRLAMTASLDYDRDLRNRSARLQAGRAQRTARPDLRKSAESVARPLPTAEGLRGLRSKRRRVFEHRGCDSDRCRTAAVRALNGVLDKRGLYSPDAFAPGALPAEAERILRREVRLSLPEGEEVTARERRLPERIESLPEEDLRTLNRHLVDSAWPKAIYSHASRRNNEVNDFILGMDPHRKRISLGEIPWSAWVRPLVFWVPVILLLWIGLVGLAVVVHRQWSRHEQLPYPIAAFADSLLPAEGEAKGSVFRNRLFWMAAGAILAIHLNNYACAWWPDKLIRIPTEFNFGGLTELFPTINRASGASWKIFHLRVYFTVVAIGYFVASDVSFSLAIGPVLWCYVAGLLAGYGISTGSGGWFEADIEKMSRAGACFGLLIAILYTGRHYYVNVFRRALGLKAREEVEPQSIWGARVFMVCAGLFTADLVLAGLDWPLAVFYMMAAVVMSVVAGRIIAETGLFFFMPVWYPGIVVLGFLGARAVGPSTALFMFFVSTVLFIDTRELLMPFVVNSLKLLEVRKAHVGRTAIWAGAAVILGLAVAVPATLMFQYGSGAGRGDAWATESVPRLAFEDTVRMKQRLKAQGSLEAAESVRGFSRLTRARPGPVALVGFACGLALVLVCSAARLRLAWWPLHPVMFAAWSIYGGYMLAFSFLLGWFIKTIVTRYGGARAFRNLKPVFFGVIAGDMLGGVIPSVVGAVYYLVTGGIPRTFGIMPG